MGRKRRMVPAEVPVIPVVVEAATEHRQDGRLTKADIQRHISILHAQINVMAKERDKLRIMLSSFEGVLDNWDQGVTDFEDAIELLNRGIDQLSEDL